MDKIISFGKGIRRQPSIGEDGELSELVNLIPKNGELVNVKPMESIKNLDDGHQLVCVHKVSNKENYITFVGENGNGEIRHATITIMSVSGYKCITTIGNVIVVSDAKGLKYAIWQDNKYSNFSQSDFNFDIQILCNTPKIAYGLSAQLGDEYYEATDNKYIYGEKMLSSLFGTLDSITNECIESYEDENSEYKNKLFKYISFGVAALRTHTNEYVAVSNIFTLDPVERNNGLYVRSIVKSTSEKICDFDVSLSGYSATIMKEIPDGMKDIIMGVDIFISMPTTLYDFSKGTEFSVSDQREGNFRFPIKDSSQICSELDNMIFYKSISIDVEDFGSPQELKRITGGEAVLDMSVITSDTYVSEQMFSYNGRLNIANLSYIAYDINSNALKENGLGYQRIPFTTTGGRYINGFYNEAQDGYDSSYSFDTSKTINAVIEVDVSGANGEAYTNRWAGKINYPLPPVISYPSSSAKKMRIYIDSPYGYRLGEYELTQLENKDMSIYVNKGNDSLSYNQPYTIKIITNEDDYIERVEVDALNENWSVISDQDYFTQEEEVALMSNVYSVYPNIVKYTSLNNPFVFSKLNTVQVGNGEIIGVSTSAKALSQGQFGQFPLYAFCSDGIWALEVANDGNYSAKQPISRDVCNNTDSITQIDGAVVFTTDQGLKLIQGSEVVLLSGQMDGHNIDESRFFPDGFFDNYDESDYDNLVMQETRDFRDILKTCKIAYDYPSGLLRIFSDSYTAYYVYSFNSKEFSKLSAEGMVKSIVAGYPSSVIQIGTTLYTFGNEVDSNTLRNGLLLTRPIDMGEPFAMKKLQDMKLHYTKHNKEKGVFVKVVVYVSNDGEHWYVLPSMRKRAFKYYRVALITKMTDNDALSGMIMRYELERTNKIR